MSMTLEYVLSVMDRSERMLRECKCPGHAAELVEARAIVSAHLAQPAQSVDVEKVREVIADLTTKGSAGSDYYSADALQDCINDAADKLTAALTEKAE